MKKGDLIVATSFEEADRLDLEYWMAMTPEERLDLVEKLRRVAHGVPGRLERVLTLAKLSEH